MGVFNFLKGQLATVVEWKDQPQNVLFHKFQFYKDEIKNASRLIIGPGQGCMLVYEGKVTALLDIEGTYFLETANDPFITSLMKLAQAFESEHKLKIYFYRKAEVTNQGWGTSSRVTYEEPQYHFPANLGAYGNYTSKITDPRYFLTEIAGLSDEYTTIQAQMLIQSRIEQQLVVSLSTAAYSILTINSKLDELANDIKLKLNDKFKELGFELANLQVQGISFDQQTQQQFNKIADAKAGSQAAEEVGLSYTEMEKIHALRDAARNESGIAGAGLQFNLGTNLNTGENKAAATSGETQPDIAAQLQKLKLLLDQGILTPEEYAEKKKVWVDKL